MDGGRWAVGDGRLVLMKYCESFGELGFALGVAQDVDSWAEVCDGDVGDGAFKVVCSDDAPGHVDEMNGASNRRGNSKVDDVICWIWPNGPILQ